MRVGLNSGEVVVRAIGNDLHMDYSAVGETTHLAARMEQLATPGSTRLTAATLHLKRFAFYCTGYPQCTNQPRMSATVIVSSACLIASISASTVRALARRNHVLIFDQHCSIGLKSGE